MQESVVRKIEPGLSVIGQRRNGKNYYICLKSLLLQADVLEFMGSDYNNSVHSSLSHVSPVYEFHKFLYPVSSLD